MMTPDEGQKMMDTIFFCGGMKGVPLTGLGLAKYGVM
jgi:hypothetical protein